MTGLDVVGLNELVIDLSTAPAKAQRKVTAVVLKGAVNVKDDARQRVAGLGHAPHYPRSITFDTDWKGSSYEAEIGPDKGGPQGALGNLLEYGSANNAPIAHLGPALDAEAPRFLKAMNDLGDDL